LEPSKAAYLGEVLREVASLSRLQHQRVVRYYQVNYLHSFDDISLSDAGAEISRNPHTCTSKWSTVLGNLIHCAPGKDL
jgi:hypothetical protein